MVTVPPDTRVTTLPEILANEELPEANETPRLELAEALRL